MDSEIEVISKHVNKIFIDLEHYRDDPSMDTTWFACATATIIMTKLSHDELIAVLALAIMKIHYTN